jgi:hypothetical protein
MALACDAGDWERTMTESVLTLARRLRKAIDEGGSPAGEAALMEIMRLHGRDIALAALEEMERRQDFEWEEIKAAHARGKRFHDGMMRLFKAFPEAKTTVEVCRAAAAHGDAFARQTLAWLESREYRLGTALDEAAAELHPGWRRNDDRSITKLDKSAPEPGIGLLEWLYKTHPARARHRAKHSRHEPCLTGLALPAPRLPGFAKMEKR